VITRYLAAALLVGLAGCVGTPEAAALGETEECRSTEVTGSRFPKKDCKTVTEWVKHEEEEARRNAELLIRNQQGVDPGTF
jgi:hypothetical protein